MDSSGHKSLVEVHNLKRMSLDQGDVLHALKISDPGFVDFGEAYFSEIKYGIFKGWKKHTVMVMNLVVPMGMVRFHIHDSETAATSSYSIGVNNYKRLTIPAGYWVAFEGLSSAHNLILNLASIEHDPTESQSEPLDKFPLYRKATAET